MKIVKKALEPLNKGFNAFYLLSSVKDRIIPLKNKCIKKMEVVSHFQFYAPCKPCSVLFPGAIIYLHCCPHRPSIRSLKFPYQIWVSRLWGLPRSTLSVSRKTTSLWHFQERFHSLRLRIDSAVSCLPKFIFSFSINTTFIAEGASMDFPLILRPAIAFDAITYDKLLVPI